MIQDVSTLSVGMIGKRITVYWGKGSNRSQVTGRLTLIDSRTTEDLRFGGKIVRSLMRTEVVVAGVTIPCSAWESCEDQEKVSHA